MIAFREAYKTVTKNISPLSSEKVTLRNLLKRVVSEDIISLFDSPSSDVSLKDGYAIVSEDIEKASSDNPVRLALIGTQFAGSRKKIILGHGKAVRITSGAIIPEGADAVIPEEFTVNKNNIVEVLADAYRGRNILRKGDNFRKGETIISRGTLLMLPISGL